MAVPAGSRISIFYAAANRDASHWDDPDTFDIHREEAKRHVGFGAGCITASGRRWRGWRGVSPSSGC